MARILSIEDDQDIQHLVGQVLFRMGYEVHYAWNGQEGYEKILALAPDLILLDLMLPLMNGVELLKKLQENRATKDIPVVIVTAYGDEANMLGQSVVALGAAAYLRKPVIISELLACVRENLTQLPLNGGGKRAAVDEVRKGSVRADLKFRTVWINDRLIATLPDKEFALLRRLIMKPGSVPQAELLETLRYADGQRNALKQVVHRLRLKLGPLEARRIRTAADGYELIG